MIGEFLQEILDGKLRVIDPTILDKNRIAPSAMTAMCTRELKKDIKNFREIKPTAGSYVVDNGFRLGRYANPDVCSTPVALEFDEGCIVSVDYNKSYIYYFEQDSSLRKSYKVNENSDNRTPMCADFTEDNIYVGTYYNRLISINKDTKDVAWEFGTYNSNGKCSDGKIGRVYDIDQVDNGNLIVAVYDGQGDAGRRYGTLEEFKADGTWVKTLLQDAGSGKGSDLETHYPRAVQVIGSTIYVGKSDDIDVFTYDADDGLTYVKTIRKPANAGVDELDLRDFTIVGDILYILSANMKKIIGFNLLNSVVTFAVGHYNYEASSTIKHEGNALNRPAGLLLLEDGTMYVADEGNYNITQVFDDDYIHPTYDVPSNIEVLYSSIPIVDGVASVPVGEEPPTLALVYKEVADAE